MASVKRILTFDNCDCFFIKNENPVFQRTVDEEGEGGMEKTVLCSKCKVQG